MVAVVIEGNKERHPFMVLVLLQFLILLTLCVSVVRTASGNRTVTMVASLSQCGLVKNEAGLHI